MKKIVSLIALLATIYMVAADGLMVHFDLEQYHQYAFNFGAILILIPACVFGLLDMKTEEVKS